MKSEWTLSFLQNAPSRSRNDVVQVEEHEGNNEDQVNCPMEEDENNNIIQDDGTNKLIQELFTRSDEDRDNTNVIYDGPLLKKVDNRLYKG